MKVDFCNFFALFCLLLQGGNKRRKTGKEKKNNRKAIIGTIEGV